MNKKNKKVTVDLRDLRRLCHACGEIADSVRARSYRSSNYSGPCGDSFCYASCSLSACHETRAQVCDGCARAGRVPPGTDE